jgi:hypothetical protein
MSAAVDSRRTKALRKLGRARSLLDEALRELAGVSGEDAMVPMQIAEPKLVIPITELDKARARDRLRRRGVRV